MTSRLCPAQVQAWASCGYLPGATRVRHVRDNATGWRELKHVPQLGGSADAPTDAGVAEAMATVSRGDAARGAGMPAAQWVADSLGPAAKVPRTDACARPDLAPGALTSYKEYSVVGGWSRCAAPPRVTHGHVSTMATCQPWPRVNHGHVSTMATCQPWPRVKLDRMDARARH